MAHYGKTVTKDIEKFKKGRGLSQLLIVLASYLSVFTYKITECSKSIICC